MGLDMYVYKTKFKPTKEVDFTEELYPSKDGQGHTDFESPAAPLEDLAYWRKHPNLHGWMEKLYRKKGGKENSFNGDQVVLTLKDLAELKETVMGSNLPNTSGFFFGNSKSDVYERVKDLEFIEDAKAAILEGYTVFYDSSW
jgi:hypothetical protein